MSFRIKRKKRRIINQHSNLKNKDVLVKDYKGVERRRGECLKLYEKKDGEVYPVYYPIIDRSVKGEGAVNVNGSFVLTSSPHIKWCDETGRWELSKKVVTGYYTKRNFGTMLFRKFQTVEAKDKFSAEDPIIYLKNEHLARDLGYAPSKNDKYFYKLSRLKKRELTLLQKKATFPIDISTTHHADEDNVLFKTMTKLHSEYRPRVSKKERWISRLLDGITFGIEFETGYGALQESALGYLGLVPLIDGSLSSRSQYEYTSVVWSGAKGLHTLKEACHRLSENCAVDKNCALHVHLGNVPDDKLFVVALHSLWTRIQEEVFAMVPHYKKDEKIMGKAKNYSAPNPDLLLSKNRLFRKGITKEDYEKELSRLYSNLFQYYACGFKLGKDFNKQNRKPKQGKPKKQTPWRNQWNCLSRYHALNFVPLFFSPSGTIEFRVHGPTLNFQKVSTWLFICTAIVRYAKNFPRKILEYKEKIKLVDVIDCLADDFGRCQSGERKEFYQKVCEYLQEYILNRTEYYAESLHNALMVAFENGERSLDKDLAKEAKKEIKEDEDFIFVSETLKNLW